MLDSIKAFVARRIGVDSPESRAAQVEGGRSPVQLAACAVLLELAYADDEFTPAERAHIESALRRHFALDEDTASELMELAEMERQQAVDYFQFARTINQHYDLGQKMVLAEVMWGVILADGQIASHESYVVRKLANLLDLAPAYLSQARRSVSG